MGKQVTKGGTNKSDKEMDWIFLSTMFTLVLLQLGNNLTLLTMSVNIQLRISVLSSPIPLVSTMNLLYSYPSEKNINCKSATKACTETVVVDLTIASRVVWHQQHSGRQINQVVLFDRSILMNFNGWYLFFRFFLKTGNKIIRYSC